eukprot:4570628-Prymnesium_polylepis.2
MAPICASMRDSHASLITTRPKGPTSPWHAGQKAVRACHLRLTIVDAVAQGQGHGTVPTTVLVLTAALRRRDARDELDRLASGWVLRAGDAKLGGGAQQPVRRPRRQDVPKVGVPVAK